MGVPKVTVIIPVYNDSQRLKLCLQALKKQTYSQSHYTVIVVDNNSTENLSDVTDEFPNVELAFEAQPGSYAARNKGIAISASDILAFTDSDCIPSIEWIEKGVQSLESEAADLVGGKIDFLFSSPKSSAELFDSITALQVKKNIETRQLTVTANLLVYRRVFDALGLFDASLQSGGDFQWTKKATDAGFKLVYSPGAKISHPARNLTSLVKKGYRVGTGQLYIQLSQNKALSVVALNSLKKLLPPNPYGYWRFVNTSGNDEARRRFISIWAIAWMANAALSLGCLKSITKELLKFNQSPAA
ncbi:glycosyltransferase [Acaryochloris sp. IP29b_bin.148]|uniref:glycosyltransferase family 2 protein n=1 Tax=Acaryochloris sp. IP29b_bin.148 TaxID=2969218 RepID=UPI0026164E00|nr:glycosyltransferase [Acaryochloris sp. IP29b_bin.148]